MTRDCDQSEHVPAEHYSYMLVNTEFVFLFVFIIFNRDLNYPLCLTNLLKHIYVIFLNKLCKVCATAALN